MFTVKRTTPSRIEAELDGGVDEAGMAEAIEALLAAADGMERGAMLYRVHRFEMPGLRAMSVKLGRLPALLDLIGRIDRIALVSASATLRTAAEIEGALIPGLEIRAFAPEAEADATAWLDAADDPRGGTPDRAPGRTPGGV